MALSIDVGLNIAGVRQGIEEIKSLVNGINNLPLTSNDNKNPIMMPKITTKPVPLLEPEFGPVDRPMTYLGKREQSKYLIDGITSLTKAIEDNTAGLNNNRPEKKEQDRKLFSGENLKNIAQLVNIGTGIYTAMAQYETSQTRKRIRQMNADPYGAMIEDVSGRGQRGNTIAQTIGNVIGIGASFSPLGPLGGMLISQIINNISGSIINANTQKEIAAIQERQTKVDKYVSRLGVMDESYMRYGLTSNMWDVQKSLLKSSKGTGLDIDEFMNYANMFGQYGISSVGEAGKLTNAAILASRYTGADKTSLINYLGTQSRYGQGNAISNMNYAYSAAVASGLQRNQYGEFLDGLQSVIENGISKGYIKSTKEVSDTMVMFNKLSDNSPFWQGQQGFQRLNSINNGLANATNLSSNSQVLVFRALQGLSGGDAINTFKLMEEGLTPETFKALSNTMQNMYGYSREEQIAAWKQISGLNYTSAEQLYKMSISGKDYTAQEFKQLTANQNIKTEQTAVKDSLNNIAVQVSEWGSKYFPEYISLLGQIVENTGGEKPVVNYDGKDLKLANNKKLKGTLNGKDVISRGDMDEFLSAYFNASYSEEQRKYLNSREDFNTNFGNLLAEANNLGSSKAYNEYSTASEKDKGRLRPKAIEENERNHEILTMLVEQLKILVENEGKKPAVITMPKR